MKCIKRCGEAEYKVTECENKRTQSHSDLAGHFGGFLCLYDTYQPPYRFVLFPLFQIIHKDIPSQWAQAMKINRQAFFRVCFASLFFSLFSIHVSGSGVGPIRVSSLSMSAH